MMFLSVSVLEQGGSLQAGWRTQPPQLEQEGASVRVGFEVLLVVFLPKCV